MGFCGFCGNVGLGWVWCDFRLCGWRNIGCLDFRGVCGFGLGLGECAGLAWVWGECVGLDFGVFAVIFVLVWVDII